MNAKVWNRILFRVLLIGFVLWFTILVLVSTSGNVLTVSSVLNILTSAACISENGSSPGQSDVEKNSAIEDENLKSIIKRFNYFGQSNTTTELVSALKEEEWDGIDSSDIEIAVEMFLHENRYGPKSTLVKSNHTRFLSRRSKATIKIGILVCGSRLEQAMVMLKSAVMFSLDVNLHVIAVSDKDTITKLGEKILVMKLLLAGKGYFGFTYELILEWYPSGKNEPDWKHMYRTCSNQRLFFPSLLKHHDALIYLDTDVLVLANLTDMWTLFETYMEGKMLGITPNSEGIGYYNSRTAIPFYGRHGINAGVMLMNLTQLREFNFEARAKAVYTAYDTKIVLADQDIINGVFHAFQSQVLNIQCHHNFYWLHCDQSYRRCIRESDTEIQNVCFCNQVVADGVRILHGNSGTFYSSNINYPFVPETFSAFENLDLYTDSYSTLFKNLIDTFNQHNSTQCPPLTADMLYLRGLDYLQKIGQ